MAYATTMSFQRSLRASRFTEALNAFFPSRDYKTSTRKSNGLEQDIVELSPYNKIRSMVSEFRRQTKVESELNLSLITHSNNTDNPSSEDFNLDKDLDMMLHMIATDDDDYERMKAEFKKLYKETISLSSKFQNTSEFKSRKTNHKRVEHVNRISQNTMRRRSTRINIKFKQGKQQELTPSEMGIIEVDPLVLDINGDGLNLTRPGKGSNFDIDADGRLDNTAWVQGDDALLVYDKNGNGKIDNGKELFGEQNGAQNGFAELSKYDKNHDGKISFLDPIYKALKLYQDINADGKIQDSELMSLNQMGIKSLNLNFVKKKAKLNGNSLLLSGTFERSDGSTGHLADVLLGYKV